MPSALPAMMSKARRRVDLKRTTVKWYPHMQKKPSPGLGRGFVRVKRDCHQSLASGSGSSIRFLNSLGGRARVSPGYGRVKPVASYQFR